MFLGHPLIKKNICPISSWWKIFNMQTKTRCWMMWCDGVDGWVGVRNAVTDKFDLAKWEKRERVLWRKEDKKKKGVCCMCININQLSIDSTFQFAWIMELGGESFILALRQWEMDEERASFLLLVASQSFLSNRSSLWARCLKGDIGPGGTREANIGLDSEKWNWIRAQCFQWIRTGTGASSRSSWNQ